MVLKTCNTSTTAFTGLKMKPRVMSLVLDQKSFWSTLDHPLSTVFWSGKTNCLWQAWWRDFCSKSIFCFDSMILTKRIRQITVSIYCSFKSTAELVMTAKVWKVWIKDLPQIATLIINNLDAALLIKLFHNSRVHYLKLWIKRLSIKMT